ncbi:MAG: PhoU family transcriptional regulator [Epsilonproteobacteria bacterium]|nr:PhoU family transcriptional regulator [Campylobacterota bacterium]
MLTKYEERLETIRGSVVEIMDGLIQANKIVLEALEDCDSVKFENAKLSIRNVSSKTEEIDLDIITTLALHTPEAKDLRELVAFLKITNELIRASSNTRGFMNGFQDVCNKVDINAINEYAIPMQKSTIESLVFTSKMLSIDCADEAQEFYNKALIAENKTDDLYEMLENEILKKPNDEVNFSYYHDMLSVLRKSEKVADRSLSIATLLLYARNGRRINQI